MAFIFVALSAWHSFQSHPFIYIVNEGDVVAGGSAFVVARARLKKPPAMKFACNFQHKEHMHGLRGRWGGALIG